MKTLTLTDSSTQALITSINMSIDLETDMLTEDIPLSVSEIRTFADVSDIKLKTQLSVIRKEFYMKLDNIIKLEVLKQQLETLQTL